MGRRLGRRLGPSCGTAGSAELCKGTPPFNTHSSSPSCSSDFHAALTARRQLDMSEIDDPRIDVCIYALPPHRVRANDVR
jgi:hypothetical protein